MSKYRHGVCRECKVKEADSSKKILYQCKFCERWFCAKHFEPRLVRIPDYDAFVKYPEVRVTFEKEWGREDGHPDFAYSLERFKELDTEEKLYSKLIENALDRSKAYPKKTPKKEPEPPLKEPSKVSVVPTTSYVQPKREVGKAILRGRILQRRLFFIVVGLTFLIGADLYGRWQLSEARLWENTFLAIFSPSGGPRTSAIFSGLLWAFTILIVLPSLVGWGAFKFLYRPVTVYEWKFVGRRKAHVIAYDHIERSFGPGLLPFLVGFFGQVALGYLVGLAIPLSIIMPLGSILLSIGYFGLLSKLLLRIRKRFA